MVAQSPEPEAPVLNARAFRIELEFGNVVFFVKTKSYYCIYWINLLNIRAMKTLFRYSILWIQPRPPTNTKKEHYSIIPRTNFLLFSGSIISRELAIG